MNKNLPIGVFDSGLGGLTVVKQIIKVLPHENIIYLGDNARVPYGGRSKEIVTKFSFENTNFLLKKKVKCIVIACNTSSAFAGDELRKKIKIPVFDVISPAVEESTRISRAGRIGVIGTRGTIGSGIYQKQLKSKNSELKTIFKATPLFVPFIEEGEIKSPALGLIASDYLSVFKKKCIDTLILGCTHYPIIQNIIEKEIDNHVQIIDPGICIAKVIKNYLIDNKILNPQNKIGSRDYYVTDYTERFIKMAEMFLGHTINSNIKKIELNK